MALYGRDANGNDAYIRASGAGSSTQGFLTFHDTYSDEVKFKAASAESGTTSLDLVPAVIGKKLRVLSLTLSSSGAAIVKIESGSSASTVYQNIYLSSNSTQSFSHPLGLFESDTGEKLMMTISGSSNVSASLSYREV